MARRKDSSIVREMRNITDTKYFAWIVIIGGGFLSIKFSNELFKGMKGVGQGLNNVIEKNQIINSNPGTTSTEYNKSFEIAKRVSYALGTHPENKTFDEDEETASFWINKIESQNMANVVKSVYKNMVGQDLWHHIDKYFDFIQIRWINEQVKNWLK